MVNFTKGIKLFVSPTDKGLEGFEDDLRYKKERENNGHDNEGAEIIDLVPFLNKNVH